VTIVYDAPVTCPPPSNFCVTSPNSSGQDAVMGWAGSTSFGANDLELNAFGLPANKFGIFFYGTNAAQIPLGNGYRCVASPFYRLGSAVSDGFGDVGFQVDFTKQPAYSGPGAITIGSTQRFQMWFRDPAGGGGRTNLTDGLLVTICP
jgi:hypothetical protein